MMSFSGKIKEELLSSGSNARHCQIAELAAIVQFGGRMELQGQERVLKIQTENRIVAKRGAALWKKTIGSSADLTVRYHPAQKGGMTYLLYGSQEESLHRLIEMLKIDASSFASGKGSYVTDARLLRSSCCKRAFLRGAYLSVGSMSDPEKSYHLELVCSQMQQAVQLVGLMQDFGLEAKMVQRKKYHVVYLKEGEHISDFLNIIEAHQGMMEFENTRIVKDMRGMVNRKVNCEIANINKTVSAAARQLSAIKYIKEHGGLNQLSDQLREMATVRLENPESSLEELGKLLDPPVGKSGVNHRLRKINEYAETIGHDTPK